MATKTMVMAAAIGLLTIAPIRHAASQTAQTDVSSALLAEVRLLRTTIEQIVCAGASGQLILGRLQLQEQRVNAAIQRLEVTQADLAREREGKRQMEESAAGYAAQLAGEKPRGMYGSHHEVSDQSLQGLIEHMKKRVAEAGEEIRRLTAEEAARAADLAAEQAVWSDLSRRLDDTERMLARKP